MEKFKKISSAYEVLKDEKTREEYDLVRSVALNKRQPSGSASSGYSSGYSGSGYAHKKSSGREEEGYAGFKSKQEFYDYFSGSKDWKGEKD